ncbi:ABC transporter permease subunit [Agrobacterium vitis]|uniref:ABC transporter permease n=1 Tax=Agrobacterium vitis TaxID=373 RepID=A0AAE5B6J8_AGRVI|nr:ABC transporter permease [Agrobacterium vitis]MBF2714137.1 ABC transporter permease [Agrobacterium vitis]MUO81516.1 ABC transporter permease subunit [Agrobacterium vitis]MUO95837.1 ABC transporter permease subunit [Agrobacterium vitis]MVA93916.1 ABC transporter permease subunit [Agrobacterium vitis]MVB03577.1 ABC transporter permease subunit [Agrobacterium vitis]
MTRSERIIWLAVSVCVGALLVLLWQWITAQRLVSPVFLPGPASAWNALLRGVESGVLIDNTLGTVRRMLYGWLLASLLGIAIGAFIGISPRIREYLGPGVEFLRPLPASAVVPLAIALLGLSETMVLAVIAFGAIWPMLLATIHGFSAVEPRLYEVSRMFRMSRGEVIFKIALPSSMPDILAGMRLGLTVALILSVVGEMLASQEGLGSWILLAARAFRAPDLYAGIIVLGGLGYLTSVIFATIERRLLRWQQRH